MRNYRHRYFDKYLAEGTVHLAFMDLSCRDLERILRKLSANRQRLRGSFNRILAKLPPSEPVRELNLAFNRQIGNAGMDYLHLLPESTTTLNLSQCGITSKGIKSLCEYLKTNTSITTLLIWGNKVGDEGAKHIADMLRVNKFLKDLSVEESTMGPKGFAYLADALTVNRTLHTLPLHSDDIGDDQVRNLCQGLKANRGIETLNLRKMTGNGGLPIAPDCIHHFVECLQSNHFLKTIIPEGPHHWGLSAWSEISFLLELNKLNRKIIKDRDATLSDWLESVIKASSYEDVNYSYYFLRNKPELCMHSLSANA